MMKEDYSALKNLEQSARERQHREGVINSLEKSCNEYGKILDESVSLKYNNSQKSRIRPKLQDIDYAIIYLASQQK